MSKQAIEMISKSQKARINRAHSSAENIGARLVVFQESGFDIEQMQYLRDDAEDLLQCVHEISAYQNALNAISADDKIGAKK